MQSSPTKAHPTNAEVNTAAAAIRAGRLVIFPTETVYGLGGDATNPAAIAAIYRLKGRPAHNPLITHVPDIASAEQIGVFSASARKLADAFWPGPLTLVVSMRTATDVAPAVTAGLATIAIRVPAHPVSQALLRQADVPVAAPSANPSGRLSPTRATDLATEMSGLGVQILDAGPCQHGLESTVIDTTRSAPRLLRQGAITAATIAERTGTNLAAPDRTGADRPPSPGMLLRHYAPLTPVRLDAAAAADDEVLLAFGPPPPDTKCFMLNLSPAGDLTEAAANLYHMLHVLDRYALDRYVLDGHTARAIAVAPIPNHGLGEVINERLTRAAASHGAPDLAHPAPRP